MEERLYEIFHSSEKSTNGNRNLKVVRQIMIKKLEKEGLDFDEKMFEKMIRKSEIECYKVMKKKGKVEGIFHAEAIQKTRKLFPDTKEVEDDDITFGTVTPVKKHVFEEIKDEDDIVFGTIQPISDKKKTEILLDHDDIDFTPKKKELCPDLKIKSFCNDKECTYSHSSECLICRNSLTGSYSCKKDCTYSHPNPEFIPEIIKTLESQGIKGKHSLRYCKVYYKHFIPQKKLELCRDYRLFDCCMKKGCGYQHIAVPCDINNSSDPKPKKFQIKDETDKVAIDNIHKIWSHNSNGNAPKNYPIQKIEKIENETIEHQFHKRYVELTNKYDGVAPETIDGFHGTAENVIPIIADVGFSQNHQINNAYGVGTYFAKDPTVSINGYCKGGKKLFICKILVDKDAKEMIYEQSNKYFIVPDVKGILPTHVITFK